MDIPTGPNPNQEYKASMEAWRAHNWRQRAGMLATPQVVAVEAAPQLESQPAVSAPNVRRLGRLVLG